MSLRSIPSVPWQITGNHWLALPCVHPADGAVYAVGLLHRGARAAVEFAGHAGFVDGEGPPLLRPRLSVDGVSREFVAEGMAWERAFGWLPTFTCTVGPLVVRGTVFAPHGRDADVAGAVYALSVENRGDAPADVEVALDGTLGHRQQRIRSARAAADQHRVTRMPSGALVLEGSDPLGLAALAVLGDADAVTTIGEGSSPTFSIARRVRVERGERAQIAFYVAAAPERDGAESTAVVMRRRGWHDLLSATRDSLQGLEQSTGAEALDRMLNRNLLFAYFYGVGRALDDAHYYVVRSRAPWNGRGLTSRDWDALIWTLPAVQLADTSLARELLLRVCELHGYAPGNGVHYMDGTLFEPGFTLEGAASYALAAERYVRDTGDDQIVEDAVLADTLYLAADDIAARRDKRVPLYTTEVALSGERPPHPFTLHANAVAAQALEILRRLLDEETAREVEDPDAVRAALRRHFNVENDGKSTFATAVDLARGVSSADDAVGSALWLPLYDAVPRDDSTYRRTTRALAAAPASLAQQCARLLGPDAASVLQWLRRASLNNGIAAEVVDADGLAVANGGDAALAGLLAYTVWYAVHTLGLRP